jgi:hypothetical protein
MLIYQRVKLMCLSGAGDLTFLVLFLGEKNFVSCMRETLQSHYGDKELVLLYFFTHIIILFIY